MATVICCPHCGGVHDKEFDCRAPKPSSAMDAVHIAIRDLPRVFKGMMGLERIQAAGSFVSWSKGDENGAIARWPSRFSNRHAPWNTKIAPMESIAVACALMITEMDTRMTDGTTIQSATAEPNRRERQGC